MDDTTFEEKSNSHAGEAEKANYRPASPNQLAYLFSVAMFALGKGEPVILRSDEATALFRIAQGKGSPVELFKVQNDPGDGRGFMAMLTPRIHSLRHRYGFSISNRTDRDPGCNRSWYWLELAPDGTPKMNAVELAEAKTGQPRTKATKQAAEPPPIVTNAVGQSLMFGDMMPTRPAPCKSFADLERGA